jgi:hypothetical protein
MGVPIGSFIQMLIYFGIIAFAPYTNLAKKISTSSHHEISQSQYKSHGSEDNE